MYSWSFPCMFKNNRHYRHPRSIRWNTGISSQPSSRSHNVRMDMHDWMRESVSSRLGVHMYIELNIKGCRPCRRPRNQRPGTPFFSVAFVLNGFTTVVSCLYRYLSFLSIHTWNKEIHLKGFAEIGGCSPTNSCWSTSQLNLYCLDS